MKTEPGDLSDRRRDRENKPFVEQLRQYQAAGVEITLNDARLPLEYIAKICTVREKGAYMCDFVADEQNYIVRINFNDVREEGREDQEQKKGQ